MINRTTPNGLKEYQNKLKVESINKVQEAIDYFKANEIAITKKGLIELTKLSNATFSKPHIIQLLKENAVCQFKSIRKIEPFELTKYDDRLYKEIEKYKNKIKYLESLIQDKNSRYEVLRVEKDSLTQDYELLLGKFHFIIGKIKESKLDIGIDIKNL